MDRIKRMFRDQTGEDLIEYGLLAAFISIVALATVKVIGTVLASLWGFIRDTIIG